MNIWPFGKHKEEVRADTDNKVNPEDLVESDVLLSALLGRTTITKEKALEISRKYKETLESSPYLTPDIVLEQYNVYQICEKRGANVKLSIPRGQDIHEEATKVGYQHCFTQTKFSQLDKCSETLKKVSPEIYNKIEKLCQSTLRK